MRRGCERKDGRIVDVEGDKLVGRCGGDCNVLCL